MKVEKIGLLGFGTVGSGVYHILTKNQMSIEKKTGVSLRIEKALVKQKSVLFQHYKFKIIRLHR